MYKINSYEIGGKNREEKEKIKKAVIFGTGTNDNEYSQFLATREKARKEKNDILTQSQKKVIINNNCEEQKNNETNS